MLRSVTILFNRRQPGFGRVALVCGLMWISAVSLSGLVQAQTPTMPPVAQAEETGKLESLSRIARALEEKKTDLARVKRQLKPDASPLETRQTEERLAELQAEYDELRDHFLEIVSGVDLAVILDQEPAEELNWSKELRTLLGPLIREVKRLTEKPRQIDALRSEVEELDALVPTLEQAVENSEQFASSAHQPASSSFTSAATFWRKHLEAARTRRTIMRQKLADAEAVRQPLFNSLEDLVRRFFQSKGRNLLVAGIATFIFLLLARKIYEFLLSMSYFSSARNSATTRFVHVIYYLISGFGAFFVFLGVLFAFGDWILLFFGIAILLGILWGSKHALPRFWSQIRLLLNVGPVREGERVNYKGIPWLVDRIGFHSYFVNPALEGGKLRLPIADLENLRSRPFAESERWFVTDRTDCVLVEDSRPCIVESQSPDYVVLREAGGGRRVFPAAQFQRMPLRCLRDGYRLQVFVRVPYDLLDESTTVLTELHQHVEVWLEDGSGISLLGVTINQLDSSGATLLFRFTCGPDTAYRFEETQATVQRVVWQAVQKVGVPIAMDKVQLALAGSGDSESMLVNDDQ